MLTIYTNASIPRVATITESTSSLKPQAARFNAKLKTFGELAKKETASVKALAVYDELTAEAQAGLFK